jgi:hypothetical protein
MAFALPFLPLALAVGSTALQGISSFQQSMYQSAVAKNNAKIAKANADRASYAGQIEQMRSDREYLAQEATVLATQAASGFDVLGRSQIMSRANLGRVRGEAALDIRNQALFNVRNLQQEQANFLGEARAQKTQAWMGLAATAFDIGGTIAGSPQGKKAINSLIGGAKSTLGG